MARILLKNGEVVSVSGVSKKNVLIDSGSGKIVDVLDPGTKISGEYKIVDCKDRMILPGVVDCHVHFREPGGEYKEDWVSGSKGAVSGGVTTVLDMPNNKPPVVSRKNLDKKRELIDDRSYVNYGLFIGYDGKNIEEINKASNIAGVKVYVANSTGDVGVFRESVEDLFKKTNKLVVAHAEDEECIQENTKKYLAEFEGREIDPAVHSKIRSPESALIAVKYVCELAKKYGKRLHIAHVSTEGEVSVVEEYKKYGVTCEVTPHHLHITEDDYEILKGFIKVNPPVRSRSDVFALWKGLKSGAIDIIDTDHAPHSLEEKSGLYLDVPSGVPGVELLLPIFLNTVNNEGLTLGELVNLCCTRPAEIFGIKGKGKIEAGYDADIVVVDMNLEKTVERQYLFSKSGWSPYEGLTFKGWPVLTYVNGKLVFEEGKIAGKPGGREVMFK
jgi:dihydroorotase